jgi:hypothetical protein
MLEEIAFRHERFLADSTDSSLGFSNIQIWFQIGIRQCIASRKFGLFLQTASPARCSNAACLASPDGI